jgi:fatty-acyl-CoA synthase
MQGLMMDQPLLISGLIRHAARHHADGEIVSKNVDGSLHRYGYAAAHARTQRLANALQRLGVQPGERVATLAWNGFRHFEIYYAVAGSGAVIHTINPRLFPDQIAYIANHAEDKLLFYDTTFAPLIEKLRPQLKSVRQFIALAEPYEDLIRGEAETFAWPEFDERTAACLCYTSGTTGNPKGALYSHRSTMIHAYAAALPDTLDISAREVVLPVVPMFHVNAWSLPYSCAMVGAKMVFPGPHLDGKSIYELFETEEVTLSAGVPTVWLALLNYMKQNQLRFSTLKRTVIGGSACPPAMLRAFQDEYGVKVLHAWGMTEMSPLGSAGTFKAKHLKLPKEARDAWQHKQGRAIFGVDMRIVDESGAELPWDGKAFGDLQVRGPCVIKSGGEWISSIDLENIAVAHPAIAEAAVIGVKHPKWDERPIVVAVKKPGQEVSKAELLKFYEGKIAKWWMPEDVLFVPELPHTATGKLSKLTLRQQLKDYRLDQK